MPYGLSRKMRLAFLLQASVLVLTVLVGVYLSITLINYGLVKNTLRKEADYFWSLHAASKAQPPPNTHTIRGYLLPTGYSPLGLPESLRGLTPGFHDLKDDDQLVLVDQREEGRLYLVFLRSQALTLWLWFGIVPMLSLLLAMYAVIFVTYRTSKRLVSPVTWLARQVQQWDPRRPESSVLSPQQLPADMQGDARQLALALHALAQRTGEHVARERNFTRDASHELRTPLTVIRVASDIALAEPALSPKLERSLRRIQRAGRDMEAVTEAFLILARAEAVMPQSEDVDVADIVAYELEQAEVLLAEKPVGLSARYDARPTLHAPPRVLHVVVGNLLRNACRYTHRGQIEAVVGADSVTILDTGIGMNEEALKRAFEPFFRAEPERLQGSGLGLSIVARLCARLGWKVELRSEPGHGTAATIHFV
ncbi:MAG TPA: two-component sensor histidine kinase [Xanthomonadaceae bacterium]|nr:two-component sensor histidine kinase [Xanthomonadaceae bacterium]